jgi:hypothetical protein
METEHSRSSGVGRLISTVQTKPKSNYLGQSPYFRNRKVGIDFFFLSGQGFLLLLFLYGPGAQHGFNVIKCLEKMERIILHDVKIT